MPGARPGPRRLDRAAVAVWILEDVGRFWVALVALLFVRTTTALVFLAVIVPLTILRSVLRYLRFSFRLEGGALVVEGGVLVRWRRVVPLARVQSVDVVQKLRHRALGVVELRIEAAGGSATEATLSALRPREADAFRAVLLGEEPKAAEVGREPAAGPAVPPPPPLAVLRPPQLLLAGITGGRVAVIAVLLGYLQELAPDSLIVGLAERLEESGRAALFLVLGAVVIFLILSLLISLAATLLVYWGFRLALENGRLVVTRGLLERRRAVVPLRRLQALRIEENLIRRAFGLASLYGVVAGYAGNEEEQQRTGTLLPVARRGEVVAVAGRILGVPVPAMVKDLEPAPSRAVVPRLGLAAVAGLGAGFGGLALFGGPGGLAFLVAPAATAWAVASWQALGHAVRDGHAVVRSGVLVRRTTVVPLPNLQHVSVRIRPIQRLLRLATLRLSIPRARPEALDLDEARAAERFGQLETVLVGEGG